MVFDFKEKPLRFISFLQRYFLSVELVHGLTKAEQKRSIKNEKKIENRKNVLGMEK